MSIVYDPLIGRYLNKFLSLVEDNIQIFNNCDSEFESMKEIVETIQDLLKTVGKQRSESLEHYTNKLRELMYDVEDIIADYSHLKLASRLGIGKKLKDINEKLKEMYNKLENSVNATVARGLNSVNRRRKPDPVNDETKIFGVGDAVRKIKKWVLNEDNVNHNRIGLVGKGGSGKTTLAQMILKDEEIKEYFDLKMMFVTVSQPVDVKKMMKSMLKELENDSSGDDDERRMSTKIFNHLKGSRYFVILDDVWDLDGGWWGTIKNALPEGSENCVLITSRMRNIVQDMGVSVERIHEPEALRNEDGWSLFCISAETDFFPEDTEMKQIGMEIVEKCRGLPLAIKVMGGVVLSKEHISPSILMEIRDKFMEHISKNENDSIVMGSLGLSYDDLRLTYLNPCLLCFGVFPEDREIYRDSMIRWWIGEDFVPLTKDGRLSVELAEKCFEELVNRSLVEVDKRDYKGSVLTCKVHDLVREMLIRKGKSEAFFEIGKDKISRRIVLNYNDISSTVNNQITASKIKVRAIVETTDCGHPRRQKFIKDLLLHCKFLRVMSVRTSQIKDRSTVESIGNLKHLKYLDVSEHPRELKYSETPNYIPPFTKSLLVLCLGIRGITTLPDSITELKQLIWLDVTGCTGVSYLPKGLEKVSTLQVLKGFKLSSSHSTTKGSSSTEKVLKRFKLSSSSVEWCRFEELRKLTELVTLEMVQISDEKFSDSELNALSELDGLRHLTIHFVQFVETSVKLDKLVLPKHLHEVKLKFYPGEKTPSWLNKKDLPRLRYLSLSGTRIRSFHANFYQSRHWGITCLELDYLHNLREDWKVVVHILSHLKTLYSYSRRRSRRDFSLGDIRLENFPSADEFDDEGVWRNPKKRA